MFVYLCDGYCDLKIEIYWFTICRELITFTINLQLQLISDSFFIYLLIEAVLCWGTGSILMREHCTTNRLPSLANFLNIWTSCYKLWLAWPALSLLWDFVICHCDCLCLVKQDHYECHIQMLITFWKFTDVLWLQKHWHVCKYNLLCKPRFVTWLQNSMHGWQCHCVW